MPVVYAHHVVLSHRLPTVVPTSSPTPVPDIEGSYASIVAYTTYVLVTIQLQYPGAATTSQWWWWWGWG